MPTMRIYFIDAKNRIQRGEWIDCADDADAHRQAGELKAHWAVVEIWDRHRKVVRLDGAENT